MAIENEEEVDYDNWWNMKSEDDQMWLMMCCGFSTPFDPKRVKSDEKKKIWKLVQEGKI